MLRAWMALLHCDMNNALERQTGFCALDQNGCSADFSHLEVKGYMLNKYTSFCLGLLKMPCTTVNQGLYCGWMQG